MSRKRTYDREDCITEICDRLAEGEPLRQICRDEHMPCWWSVYQWIDEDDGFASRIAHARKVGYDAIAEDILQIADTPEIIVIEEDSDGRRKTIRKDATDHRKLRIWSRLQLLAKWYPTKYGDKQAIELSGAGVPTMNDEERARRIEALLARARARMNDSTGQKCESPCVCKG